MRRRFVVHVMVARARITGRHLRVQASSRIDAPHTRNFGRENDVIPRLIGFEKRFCTATRRSWSCGVILDSTLPLYLHPLD
jgi:hypothetical protein